MKERIKTYLLENASDNICGIYLYGSSVLGGLKPSSDLDFLVITEERISDEFRKSLTRFLLGLSGRIESDERCIELSIFVKEDVNKLSLPLECHYMYGEWLREDLEEGGHILPFKDDDNAIVLALAQHKFEILYGVNLMDISTTVPLNIVKKSIHDNIEGLIENASGDERNVILTACRMFYTLCNDTFTSKDLAAIHMKDFVSEDVYQTILKAKDGYLLNHKESYTPKEVNHTLGALLKLIKKN